MPDLEKHTARYWAYANYLTALSQLIQDEYATDTDLVSAITRNGAFSSLSRTSTPLDQSLMAKTLRRAWFTELLLAQQVQYPQLLPFSLPWTMVQAYYSIHPALRAYFLACGRKVEDTHETTLRTISSDVFSYAGRFPPPWSSVLIGDPSAQFVSLSNLKTPISLTNPLVSPHAGDPWQHFGLFLKTTRQRQVNRLATQWKQENHRKRLPHAQRVRIASKLRPTTVFDALYRLRSRSNYQDIDSFAFSSADRFDFIDLQTAICRIIHKTLLVLELPIARLAGKSAYSGIVQELETSRVAIPAASTVLKRWALIKDVM